MLVGLQPTGSNTHCASCFPALPAFLSVSLRVCADVEAYDSYCGPQTARLFLESMYREFLSKHKGVLHLMLLNHEHLFTQDADVHAKMQVFIW